MLRVLLIVAIVLLLIGLPTYLRLPAERQRRLQKIVLLGIGLLVLAFSLPGLFGLIIPLGAALLAGLSRLLPLLLRYAPLLHRFWMSYKSNDNAGRAGTSSRIIRTRFLVVELDLAGQVLDGEVGIGQFSGRLLASLSTDELQQLLLDCGSDQQSVMLLRAYIAAKSEPQHNSDYQNNQQRRYQRGPNARMSKQQAAQVLGVSVTATKKQIKSAHRRLMQKAHPDHGGTDQQAAHLNQARDVLLGK